MGGRAGGGGEQNFGGNILRRLKIWEKVKIVYFKEENP